MVWYLTGRKDKFVWENDQEQQLKQLIISQYFKRGSEDM